MAQPATAAQLAHPATPEQAPAASVALDFQFGGGSQPQAKQPTGIRVAPIDAKGQVITQLDPLLGGDLLMVAMRYDLGWLQVQSAPPVAAGAQGKRQFTVKFPQGGRHLLYFLFQPKGKPMAKVPVDLTVAGPDAPAEPWVEQAPRFAGPDGLEVGLKTEPANPAPCQPFQVATTWLRRGKPLPLLGGDRGRVIYLLVSEAMGPPSAGQPIAVQDDLAAEASAAAANPAVAGSYHGLGGDLGSDALLTATSQGSHKILAIAAPDGPSPLPLTAQFGLAVAGKTPPGGCPQ